MRDGVAAVVVESTARADVARLHHIDRHILHPSETVC